MQRAAWPHSHSHFIPESHIERERTERKRANKTQRWLKTTQPKLCPSNIRSLLCARSTAHGESTQSCDWEASCGKNTELTVRVLLCVKEWACPEVVFPAPLFVLIFLTIKPQGHKKEIHRRARQKYKVRKRRMRLLHEPEGPITPIWAVVSWTDRGDDYSSGVRLRLSECWNPGTLTPTGENQNIKLLVVTSSSKWLPEVKLTGPYWLTTHCNQTSLCDRV